MARRALAITSLLVLLVSPIRPGGFGLASSGSGPEAPAPPPDDPPTFHFAGNGNSGNNPNVIPGAYQRGGTVFFGWVDRFGNIEAAQHSNGVTGAQQTIHASFEVDAHTSPALLRRLSDGRVITVYAKHGTNLINKRTSTNPDSVSAWSAASSLDSQLGGSTYTNPQLHQLDVETNDPIYLFYRDEPVPGTDSRYVFSTSTDGGSTWATQQILYRIASKRSYVKSGQNGTGRIDFVATNGGSTIEDSGFTRLGHFYYEGGAYFQTDGTAMGSPPFDFDDITEIYSGTFNVFASSIAFDGDGHPVIGAQDNIGGDLRYIYIRWDGADWSATNVVSAGDGWTYTPGSDPTVYGSAIDHGNPDDFWLIRDEAGQPEVFRYRTADGGATFTPAQVTFNSTELQVQLIQVQNPDSSVRVFWGRGSWTSSTNWNMVSRAVGSF